MSRSNLSNWVLYNLAMCFAVYWLSNVVLWYPWSIDETLGQILMLTVNPVLWGVASYVCIVRYPKSNMIMGAVYNSILFISGAIISDLIFFGLIRNAMDKLMHPTTLYGWCFVFLLPLLIYLLFRRPIIRHRRMLVNKNFREPLIIGSVSFFIIIAILAFDITFS